LGSDEHPGAGPGPGSLSSDHRLRNQVAIVVSYCELLLHETQADSPLRADLVEMHKAAVIAMNILRETDGGSC
jgi:hypothetical protein